MASGLFDRPAVSPSRIPDPAEPGQVRGESAVARNTALVALLTLASRVTGFARVAMIAAVLGVNRFSDLYQSLNLLPNYTHELLTGSLITALLVPPLVRHLDGGDVASMRRVAGGFLTLVIGVALVVVLVVTVAGVLVVRALTLGVTEAADHTELIRLGWPLLALLMPQVVFYAVAATGAAAQNAAGRFALAAAAPVVENVMIMAVIGLWAGLYGSGIESLAGVGTHQVVFLGTGTTAAVFLHAALQWFGAARCGVALFPRRGWRDPEVLDVVRLARPSVGYAALNTARLVVFLVAAGLVSGGQTAFLIALNFFNLPVALISKPLATTAMPVLARLRTSSAAFAQRSLRTLGVLLLLAVPAAAMMAGLARPVAIMGLWGSAATPEAITLLTAAVAAVAFAVPGESAFIFATSAAYAKLDAHTPFRAMALRLLATVMLVAAAAVADRLGLLQGWQLLAGLGAAMAAADALGAGYLTRRIMDGAPTGWSGMPATHPGVFSVVGPQLLIGLAIFVVTGWCAALADQLLGLSRPVAVATIVCGAVTGLAVAAAAGRARRSTQFADFAGVSAREMLVSRVVRRSDARSLLSNRAGESTTIHSSTPRRDFFALLIAGVIGGVAAAVAGPTALAAAIAAAVIGFVARRPVLGVLLLLGSTPLTVGLIRGSVVPLLRPNEAVLFLVAGGVAIHAVRAWLALRSQWDSQRSQALLASPRDRLDWAIGLLVLAGSVLPLLVRFGRGGGIGVEDVTQAFVFAKFGLLYFVVRYAVRTHEHVRRCLTVSLVATVPVAFLALAQSMQLPGVAEALRPWLDQPPEVYVGRGAGTIGNSIALGDVMAVHLGMALMLLFRHRDHVVHDTDATRRRTLVLGLAVAAFALGAFGSGQFSGFAAAATAIVVVTIAAGRPRALLALPLGGLVVGVGLWPVISRRLAGLGSGGRLPQSWQARLDNLNEFFLPVLGRDFNWALGVRPDTSVENPDEILGETFIESGFVWMLWVGGLLLVVAFALLLTVALRRFATAARHSDPWFSAVGGAGLAATAFIGMLTLTDPHLTLRGMADVYFPLLAISLVVVGVGPASGKLRPARPSPPTARVTGSPALGSLVMPPLGFFRYTRIGGMAKRWLDVAVSGLLLSLLAPVLLLIGVTIRLTSPGPALFRQERIGFGETPFTIWKFRTMRSDSDDREHREFVKRILRDGELPAAPGRGGTAGEPFKMVDDPRITTLGRFLRRHSVDELPQLVNVLRGDMSLVGPRPCLAYELDEYSDRHRLRAMSVPGMTGLWQVEGRNDLHLHEALDIDTRYVESCSMATDLGILVRTVGVVVKGSGV